MKILQILLEKSEGKFKRLKGQAHQLSDFSGLALGRRGLEYIAHSYGLRVEWHGFHDLVRNVNYCLCDLKRRTLFTSERSFFHELSHYLLLRNPLIRFLLRCFCVLYLGLNLLTKKDVRSMKPEKLDEIFNAPQEAITDFLAICVAKRYLRPYMRGRYLIVKVNLNEW